MLSSRSRRQLAHDRPNGAPSRRQRESAGKKSDLNIFKNHTENGRGGFRLDQHVPYLLNFDGGQLSLAFAQALRATPIRYRMWRVLHTLWHLGPLTLTEVAMLAVFDISTLSRVADDLERKKLIFRVKRPHQRAPRLDLTEKGATLVERMLPVARQCEKAALRGLSSKDKDTLVRLLQRVAINLNARGERNN
jgi:MarR family transcriptional regulator, organic hydroperoxide resistance regulator